MKTSARLIAVILIASLCLAGCSIANGVNNLRGSMVGASAENDSAEASGVVEEDDEEVIIEKEPKVDNTIMADLEEVSAAILEGISIEQSLGYPLDENFIAWFYSNYGEQITRNLLERVKNPDSAAPTGFWTELTGNTLHVLWVYYCEDSGLYPETLENVYYKDANGTDIVISFTGDLNFDDDWPNAFDTENAGENMSHRVNEGLLKEMVQSDILMINNEFTYGVGGTPLEDKAYTFQAHPSKVKWLTAIGVDIVSLANNHVYDYGAEGLITTLETLEDEGIPYVGAGRNINEAKKIVYFIINGKKIAFTAATQIERTYDFTKEATATTPGVLKTLIAAPYLEVIAEADANADYVIAFPHWGAEGVTVFEGDQEWLAKKYVEYGADVVIGGHTHCLQGLQLKNGVPVFYSLGNFWFDWEEANSKATCLAQVIIHEDGTTDYRFIPCVYDEYVTYRLTLPEDIQAAYEYMESISDNVDLDENGYWIINEESIEE